MFLIKFQEPDVLDQMHSEKVSGLGEVLFMSGFSLLTLLSAPKVPSWLAVPPIIITQTNHALVIQSFNLFDNIIIIQGTEKVSALRKIEITHVIAC